MLNKKENEQVLEYIHRAVPKIINSNPTFVKVFGNNMARENLIRNVKKVYTNEVNAINAGYFENKHITICSSGKFGKKLTVKDISKKRTLLEIVIHECIHAILYRGELQGTGILQYYAYNQEENETSEKRILEYYDYNQEENVDCEAGRGLNEGYTVWLCKKLGFKGKHYQSLTKIIEQIECAVGTERTMRLGKGIESRDFYSDLGMGTKKGKKLIAYTDDIYWRNLQIKYLYEMREEIYTSKNMRRIKKAIDKYGKYELSDYIEELEKNLTKEEMIEYISDTIEEREKKRDLHLWKTEKMMFEEYFLEDFNKMKNASYVPMELLRKLGRYQSLLNSSKIEVPEEDKNSEFTMFIKTPILLKEKKTRIYEQTQNNISNDAAEFIRRMREQESSTIWVNDEKKGIEKIDISRFE